MAGQKIQIGACLIVKNEEHVIERCLDSIKRFVDFVLIEDTGSSDGTKAVIEAWLKLNAMPGRVVDEPWKDFAHNRSHALAELRQYEHIDYAFVIDADDALVIDDDTDIEALKASLELDLYAVDLKNSGVSFHRNQLCSNKIAFHYRGVLHEFMEAPDSTSISKGALQGLYIKSSREGARNRDPQKYLKDAQVLEKALLDETDPFMRSRYTFYLARSYRDCGNRELALENYLLRADMGFWAEEVFMSLFEAANTMAELGYALDATVATYMRATDIVPARAEALHAASRLCRLADRFEEAFSYADRGLKLPMPSGGLFLQSWVYDYGLLDEYAVSAYWVGKFRESLWACTRLLSEGKMPEAMRDRVEKNASFSRSKLAYAELMPIEGDKVPLGRAVVPYRIEPGSKSAQARAQVFTKQFPIYRTIHIVWIGDDRRRPDNCINTWREMNPDWNIVVWGNEQLNTIRWRNETHMRAMLSRELCGVADMMRWEILDQFGGFAIDAGTVCLRPLPEWLFEPAVFASWENEIARPGLIANGYVYAHPANTLIREIIAEIERLPDMSSGMAWQLTGPTRLTETVKKLRYVDLTIYPSHFFMPRHLTGTSYEGTGPVFAKQFWGRANTGFYDDLAKG